jgi:tripartite ATP-independent transporter DctP family solute receptor
MYREKIIATIVVLTFFLSGAVIFPQIASAKTVIKITHVLDPSHHYQAGALKFKELVEKRTNQAVEVQIYPAAQLGSERVVLEGLQMGTIEMGIITSGALSGFVPDFAILDLGYLFKDNTQAVKVLNGPFGKSLFEQMKSAGIRGLAPIDCGFRSVYAHRPVKTPADLQGMKIRTMENPAHLASFKALGASPMPMAWGELYTALQQRVVDAAENVIDVYFSSKHFEVAKHYSTTNHVYLVVMFMASEKFLQKQPKNIQEAITSSAQEAAVYEHSVFVKNEQEAYQKLKAAGVTITGIKDLSPFQSIVENSWPEIAKKIKNGPENLEKIKRELGKN